MDRKLASWQAFYYHTYNKNMNRYQNIQESKTTTNDTRPSGKRYYNPVKYPEIPLYDNDIYVVTSFGDRLDLLANQYYSDVTLYWIIAAANPQSTPSDSLFIPAGIQLRIPLNINDIITRYNILNSL